MALAPAFYSTGTATVAANGTAVTGQGTSWLNAVQPGDVFGTHKGFPIRIASVGSNTSLTLAFPWPGGAQSAAAYEIMLVPDASRVMETSRQLLETLTNGNLASIAALTSAPDKVPYYTGAGAAALTDIKAKGRDVLAADSMLSLLGKLGPVNGGVFSPVPSNADVGLTDGDFNTIRIPGAYTITGTWVNGYNGAAAGTYTGLLIVHARSSSQVFQEFYEANSGSPIIWRRFSSTGGSGTWPNPWWNVTSPAFAGAPEINNASLPIRIRSAAAVSMPDADALTESGFYFVNASSTNIPEGAQGSILVQALGSTVASQVYIRTSNGSSYMRWKSGATWSAWAKIALQDRGNTWVGTQVVDSGGGYVQFAVQRGAVLGSYEAGTSFVGVGSVNDHPLIFKANNVERARIEPTNGDFLVGLTATIDPANGSTTGVAMRPATGRMWRRSSGYNPFIQARLATDGSVQDFYRENTSVGSIQVSGTGTTYATTSDYRRKYDVQPIVTFSLTPEQFDVLDNAELKIMALRPVFHRWNDAPEKGVVTGFLAHEAQQVVPHAVTGKKDEVVDVGLEIFPAHEVEREIADEYGSTKTVTVTVPEVVNEGVRRDALAEGAVFEKTGEEPVFQTMDYGLITADIVAALQCVIHKNMLQGEEIEALKAANADMAARLAAIESLLA
ncbi:pyocin knob domain-containing S74 family peptidase [Sinorhizobium meliloti]|uniref:pyocin knob domain-containing S74 family peptidase n=1 Tax=Rhizobium meliloti TaxID=382 RepID=UPI000FD89B81|nr:pyocin knob domain-containing S74 family peptidase [Sinorhizobium meliloti]RVK13428.1 tail fiber domain-containing protein [Sinorhizobium meliloti]